MIRKIIHIDEEKCNGCGACANACHEGAIQMVDGKARLMRDDFCDGLGDCLPACPTNAITFEEREADAYDDDAVKAHLAAKGPEALKKHLDAKKAHAHDNDAPAPHHGGCPGSMAREIQHTAPHGGCPGSMARSVEHTHNNASASNNMSGSTPTAYSMESQLRQWPVQIKLAPLSAPYFQNANLLIAADCTAYAYGNFHNQFIKNHVVLIGCPKLDAVDYTEKLTEIIKHNDFKSLTIVRMEVPCCGGLEHAATEALKASGKFIPWQVVTIGINGTIKDI